MIDIDYFKNYNDNYGHGAGDGCLRRVADALDTAAGRPGDLVARYGGEEFVVLLPDTDAIGARQIAERIREQVLALRIPHEFSSVNACVTISLGVAAITPSEASTPAMLLDQADQQLYQAKTAGRNRVSSLPAE
jgi:diguanylate cyclase (GGDEF)-like protein